MSYSLLRSKITCRSRSVSDIRLTFSIKYTWSSPSARLPLVKNKKQGEQEAASYEGESGNGRGNFRVREGWERGKGNDGREEVYGGETAQRDR